MISALNQSLADEIVELRREVAARTHEAARWRDVANSRYTVDDLTKHRAEGAQEALEAARDQIMSLTPTSDAHDAPVIRQAFRNGHSQARYAARDLLTSMIRERAEEAPIASPPAEAMTDA